MRIRKNIALFIIISLLGSVFFGCQETENVTEETTENLPQIVVGSDDYPPFNYLDVNGNPTGIDVDLAKEAFRRLGYSAVFSKIDWANKDTLVDNGSIDCIWGCFSMKGRESDYKWAGPYMVSRQVVAVNVNSDIRKLSDLDGKTIAVQATSKPESIFLNPTDSKIPNVKEVYSIENREYIYTSLGKGYVDAIAGHETSIRQYMNEYRMKYRILDESLLTTGIGVAFSKKDNRGIDEKLTKVFKEMKADGTTKKIVGKYLSDVDKYLEVESCE